MVSVCFFNLITLPKEPNCCASIDFFLSTPSCQPPINLTDVWQSPVEFTVAPTFIAFSFRSLEIFSWLPSRDPHSVAALRRGRASLCSRLGSRTGSSFAMSGVAGAASCGARIVPAVVGNGAARAGHHGGTVSIAATAPIRRACILRRHCGSPMAGIAARGWLNPNASVLRRQHAGARHKSTRACRLAVNAHGDHGTYPSFGGKPGRHCRASLSPKTPRTRLPPRGRSGLLVVRFGQVPFLFVEEKGKRMNRLRFATPRKDLFPLPIHDLSLTCCVLPASPSTLTGHSHASSGRPSFSGHGGDDEFDLRDEKKPCCGGSVFGDETRAADGSFDEEAFLSEAGIVANSGEFDSSGGGGGSGGTKPLRMGKQSEANLVENALTAFYRVTRIGRISDYLRGNSTVCLIAWGFLLIAGVAHGLTHVGALAANFAGAAQSARFVETVATVAVYLVSGPSEFVDVSYELAVGNVNIHVLTTLAVWGTVLLGCALEGALLLVLFSTAAFVEMRLTGHAKGDLKSLWATVPGEATVIDVDVIGAPVTGSEKLVPARDVTVGTHVFVKSGQQVRFFLFGFSTRRFFRQNLHPTENNTHAERR